MMVMEDERSRGRLAQIRNQGAGSSLARTSKETQRNMESGRLAQALGGTRFIESSVYPVVVTANPERC